MPGQFEDYVHLPMDRNLNDIHRVMEYNTAGLPSLRTTAGASSTTTGGTQSGNWYFNIATGQYSDVAYVEKFGYNELIATDKETIWDGGGIYQYIDVAETVSVAAVGGDNPTGTGARTIKVSGLDVDYLEIEEVITVGGAPSTLEFLRVFRASVDSVGTSGVNENDLEIISSDTATLLAQISVDGTGISAAGRAQTFMCLYTVPAGKTAYISQWTLGSGKQNTDATGTLHIREFGANKSFNAKDIITSNATTFAKNYVVPLQVLEKEDIEVRAFSSVNNTPVSSTFNIILIDNPVV